MDTSYYPELQWYDPTNPNIIPGNKFELIGVIIFTHPTSGQDYTIGTLQDNRVVRIIKGHESCDRIVELGVDTFYPPVLTYQEAVMSKTSQNFGGVYDPYTNSKGRIIAEESLANFIDKWEI